MTAAEAIRQAAEVIRQAAAEGLELEESERSATGFKGVMRNGRAFAARISDCYSVQQYLGTFDTPEEAALAYARAREYYWGVCKAGRPTREELPIEERVATQLTAAAVRQAAAEGLPLEGSGNATGFRGVHHHGRRFAAQISDGSRGQKQLGTFDTAEEAALAYARARAAYAAGPAQVRVQMPSKVGSKRSLAEIDVQETLVERRERSGASGAKTIGEPQVAPEARCNMSIVQALPLPQNDGEGDAMSDVETSEPGAEASSAAARASPFSTRPEIGDCPPTACR